MNINATSSLTSTTFRRPRVGPLLSQAAAVAASTPNRSPSLVSASYGVTRRHHNTRRLHYRTFSTLPSPSSITQRQDSGVTGRPSLAVRLLQPSATVELPLMAWSTIAHTHVSPPVAITSSTAAATRGGISGSYHGERYRPPFADLLRFSAGSAALSELPSLPIAVQPTSGPSELERPTREGVEPFAMAFVNAYWDCVTQGMSLGLTVKERADMRASMLTAWLHSRRRGPERLSSTPAVGVVERCLAEEIDAAAAFFSTPRSPTDGSDDSAAEQHLHCSAWHVFCLKTLFEAAVQQQLRQRLPTGACGPGDDTKKVLEERERMVRRLFTRLMGRTAVPASVLETLIPVVVRIVPSEQARWKWRAEFAAMCSQRVQVYNPLHLPDPVELSWPRYSMPNDVEKDGDEDGNEEFHRNSLARGKTESSHDVPQQRRAFSETSAGRRGEHSHLQLGQQPTHRSQDWRKSGVVATQPPEEDLAPVTWTSFVKSWTGHYRPLIAHALSSASLVHVVRQDVALQSYAKRLRGLLKRCAQDHGTIFDRYPPHVPQTTETSDAEVADLLSAVAAHLSVREAPAPLAELLAFLFVLSTYEDRCRVYKAAASRSLFSHVAAGLVPNSSTLKLLAITLCDDVSHARPAARDVEEVLASVAAAARSPTLLTRAMGAVESAHPHEESAAAAIAFLTKVCVCCLGQPASAAAFPVLCVSQLGEKLCFHWKAVGASHDRAYHFPTYVAEAVWTAYLPLATRLLLHLRRHSPSAASVSDEGSERCTSVTEPGQVLTASALAVSVELNYLWDAAVCRPRQQQRRLARRASNTASGEGAPRTTSVLCAEMLNEMRIGQSSRSAVMCAQDYAAPDPIPQHTKQYAQLLLALLQPVPTPPQNASHSEAAILKDSITLSQLCSALLVVLREIDPASAEALLTGLDSEASCLVRARSLDTHAALAVLRCVAAPRFGCPLPRLAVKYFAAALQRSQASVEGGGRRGRAVDWEGEASRVLLCLSHDTSGLAHAERCAAMLRFTALMSAHGIRLSATACATLQEGFVTKRSATTGSGGKGLFSGAAWSDVEGRYHAWMSAEAPLHLLLRLPELQRSCVRSLLVQGKWREALPYLPISDLSEVGTHVFGVFQDRALWKPSQQREVAACHTLLYMCAADLTKSSETSAKALASHLLCVAPTAVKEQLRSHWQRWYRASRPPPLLLADLRQESDVGCTPQFRPFGGQRFIPWTPAAAVGLEAELRVRFTDTGELSYLAQCCATLNCAANTRKGERGTVTDKVPSPHAPTQDVGVSTSYVSVAAALRKRS